VSVPYAGSSITLPTTRRGGGTAWSPCSAHSLSNAGYPWRLSGYPAVCYRALQRLQSKKDICTDRSDRSRRAAQNIWLERLTAVLYEEVSGVLDAQSHHHGTRARSACLGIGDYLIGSQCIKRNCQAGLANLGRRVIAPSTDA
jgi:hypothetical protein